LNYAATEAFQLLYVQMGDPTARLVIQDLELSEIVRKPARCAVPTPPRIAGMWSYAFLILMPI
jgi:hypothetical protein